MHWNYHVFGLTLRSATDIPTLVPSGDDSSPPDIQLELGRPPETASSHSNSPALFYKSLEVDESGNPAFHIWSIEEGRLLHLDYHDGVKAWFERDGTSIWLEWTADSSKEDALSYLLGPILGLVLRFRGQTCLHGSAIVIGEFAVALVGAEGSGKSTLAATFSAQGRSILSDDIVALTESLENFCVQPAYPYLSLWLDSTKLLFGSGDALPPFSQTFEKRRLSLNARPFQFASAAVPLGGIYIIGDRRADSAPFVERLTPQAVLMALVANTYAANVIDSRLRAQEFAILSRLVRKVPVRRIVPHQDLERCLECCELLQADFNSMKRRFGQSGGRKPV